MTLRLNYLAPNDVLVQTKVDTTLPHFDAWLDFIMTRPNADMWNFFFTEDTTDIFEEWDFNEVATSVLDPYCYRTLGCAYPLACASEQRCKWNGQKWLYKPKEN